MLLGSLIRGMQVDVMKDAVENLSGNLKVLAPTSRRPIDRPRRAERRLSARHSDDEMICRTRRVRVPAVDVGTETRHLAGGNRPREERTIRFWRRSAFAAKR